MALRIFIRRELSTIIRAWRIKKLHLKGYTNIQKNTVIEGGVGLDKLNRKGIYIGSGCLIASGTTILSHEHIFVKPDGSYYFKDTHIGNNCFIGVNSLICPGVHIGNECVVGGGTIVTKDVPNNCMVVGVPAKIVKTGIHMNDHARLEGEFKYKE
jgi:acetyltransferase-like isoleucine patch superfamily enzyme